MTLLTGNGDDYISASRALARQLLKAHLSALGLIESVMEFDDLEDEDWMAYYHRKKVRASFLISGVTLIVVFQNSQCLYLDLMEDFLLRMNYPKK